jgi:hypothetical protein
MALPNSIVIRRRFESEPEGHMEPCVAVTEVKAFNRKDHKGIREVRKKERDCLSELCGFLRVLCGQELCSLLLVSRS